MFGIEVFDAAGNLTLGSSDYMTRFLGAVSLPATAGLSGSISEPEFASGKPFYLMSHGAISITNDLPAVSISGTTLSWDTGDFGSSAAPTLYYGVWGTAVADYASLSDFGIQVFNEDGFLQFDTDSVPFVLRDKQTVAYASGVDLGGSSTARNYTISTTVPNPIVAFAGSAAVLLRITDNGDGTWTVGFVGSSTDTSAAFTLYIFGTNVGATPATGFGFEVYDQDGNVTFNHEMQPLRIYGAYDLTSLSQTLISSGSMPSGKSLAIIQCRPFTRLEYIDNPSSEIGEVRKYVTIATVGSSISTLTARRGSIFPDVDTDHNVDIPGFALVLDVTHY